MDIKIIDNNSDNGVIIRKRVLEAINDLSSKVTITILSDNKDFKKYNINKYPSIIINNNIRIEGRLITIKELNRILKREEKKLEII